MHVDLRPVERAVAGVELVVEARGRRARLSSARLGVIPQRVVADPLLGARRELEPHLEAEHPVDLEAELQAAGDLVVDLLLGAEDVRVVLCELAHAQEAVQRARGLVAVQQAGLVVADRQVAVGVVVHRVEHAVAGAVHRLEPDRALVVGR